MRRALVVLCVAGCLILAGCSGGLSGDGDDGDGMGETPTPTTATSQDGGDGSDAPDGTVEVHFINVGQSVSTLVISPNGETMLIDTGDFRDDGELVLEYLRRHNIERIDYMVSTHGDADHIGGNAAIIEYYETQAEGIGAIYDPGITASTNTYNEYLDAVEEYDVTLFRTLEGDTIPMESVQVQVLGPPQPYLEGEARNENSIVTKLTFGDTSFLFTGDAEDDQEAYLVENYGDQLQADVLKAGHHGSKTSNSGALLDAVDPSAVVISSAYDSQYGHPNEVVLQRLAERSIPAYWTGIHGNVVLVSDGTSIDVRTQQAGTTNPLQLKSGDPITPGVTDPVETREQIVGDGDPVPVDDTETPETTTVVADGGVSLSLAAVNADAAGNDRDNLNDEYIALQNTGEEAVDLGGWTLSDAAGATYTFPDGFVLAPGSKVTIHTGSGTDSETDLYWGSGNPVWNNDGDTVIVQATDRTTVLEETY